MRHPLFARIFAERPGDYPHALEQKFERILLRIGELWASNEMSAYFEDLLIDKRGGRQGFPADVARDIFRLHSTYEAMLRRGEIEDPWAHEAEQAVPAEFSTQDFGKAIETNDVGRIAALLDGGMPVDLRLANGWTPLMVATFNSCEEAALLLVRRGAKVSVSDDDGYTPLHWASLNGFAQVVPLLLKRGAPVDADTRYGFTPLMQAAGRGHVAVARCLIEHGAAVNHQDLEGWTALHKAVSNGHLETCLLLLSRGARADIPHKSGITATDIARNSKRSSLRRLFGATPPSAPPA